MARRKLSVVEGGPVPKKSKSDIDNENDVFLFEKQNASGIICQ